MWIVYASSRRDAYSFTIIWIELKEKKKMSIRLMKHRVNIEYAK